ncbi:MAG: hypothetical protein WBN92_06170 [Terriglobia bacterium]
MFFEVQGCFPVNEQVQTVLPRERIVEFSSQLTQRIIIPID